MFAAKKYQHQHNHYHHHRHHNKHLLIVKSSSSAPTTWCYRQLFLFVIGLIGAAQAMQITQDFNNNNSQIKRSKPNQANRLAGPPNDHWRSSKLIALQSSSGGHSQSMPTEISLRQVLVPLLNAGHLNRIYYAKQGGAQTSKTNNKASIVTAAVAATRPLEFESNLERGEQGEPHNSNRLLQSGYSPNNRGPTQSLLAATTGPVTARLSHLLQDSKVRFGERRRGLQRQPATNAREDPPAGSPAASPTPPALLMVREDREHHHQQRSQASSINGSSLGGQYRFAWSQPDPRKSYSLPVALVRVNGGSNKRTAAGGASRRSLATAIIPRDRLRSPSPMPIRRDEFDNLGSLDQTLPSLLPEATQAPSAATAATTTTTTTAMSTNRVRFPTNETDNDLGGASSSSSSASSSLDTEQNEILFADVPRRQSPATTGGSSGQPFESQKQHQAHNSMVTLIRYLPVIMSVPADQLSALVSAPTASASTTSSTKLPGADAAKAQAAELMMGLSHRQHQNSHHHHQSQSADSLLASGSAGALLKPTLKPTTTMLAKYQLIEPLTLAGVNSHHHHLNQNNQHNQRPSSLGLMTPDESQSAQQQLAAALASGDISSDYSQLYPLTSGAFPVATGSGPHVGRIAYIPASSQSSQSLGTLPTVHMTSKALSAYASKLIAMLRPSSLLSSIGAGANSQLASLGNSLTNGHHNYLHHHHQPVHHQPTAPHIILLAPTSSETLAAHSLMGGGSGIGLAKPLSQQPGSLTASATRDRPQASQLPRAEDLLLNQASKVHSTKSNNNNRQQQQTQQTNSDHKQQQQQQIRLPMGPQMNGLICIQGMIGSKQAQQQQQQQQQPVATSQNQMQEEELGSFDYEPRPASKGEASQSGSKTSQSGGSTANSKSPLGNKGGANKGGGTDGQQQRYAKESPIRIMQKIANKIPAGQDNEQTNYNNMKQEPQQQQQEEQQDFGQAGQQRLMGLPSESRSVFESERESTSSSSNLAAANQQQTTTVSSQSVVANQNEELAPSGDPARRSIIPFTIRDKIDTPKGGRAQQQQPRRNQHYSSGQQQQQHRNQRQQATATANNGPVQYDEPAEIELPTMANTGSGGGGTTSVNEGERRSRTSFVYGSTQMDSGAVKPAATSSKWRSQAPANEIDYRKESVGQREFSMPVLMASSSSSSSPASQLPSSPSSSVNFAPPAQQSRAAEDHDLGYERNGHQRSPFARTAGGPFRSPAPPAPHRGEASSGPNQLPRHSIVGASSVNSAHELMGLPSSSAGVVSTSTSATNSNVNPQPSSSSTTMASNRQQQQLQQLQQQQSFNQTTESSSSGSSSSSVNSNSNVSLGRLISSISLTGDMVERAAVGQQQTLTTTTPTEPQTTPPQFQTNDNTVELVVNSTLRDPQRAAAVKANEPQPSPASSSSSADSSDSAIITASPLTGVQLQTSTVRPAAAVGATSETSLMNSANINGDTTGYNSNLADNGQAQLAEQQLQQHQQPVDLLMGQGSQMNAFSHDRTLTLSENSNQFGRISESLQTNPLDLIDLQNSRSSFELPDQLESLSMLEEPSRRHQSRQVRRRRHQNQHQYHHQDDERPSSGESTTRGPRTSSTSAGTNNTNTNPNTTTTKRAKQSERIGGASKAIGLLGNGLSIGSRPMGHTFLFQRMQQRQQQERTRQQQT